jgi:hypothetical protein
MNRWREPDDVLTRALRAVAAEDEQLAVSADVRARLLAETSFVRSRHRRAVRTTYAAAAVLTLAVSAAVWSVRPETGEPSPDGSSAAAAAAEATEFFPLFYSRVPAAAVHIVRLEVPREALASFGVAASGTGTSPTVVADVVVGNDGLARAIRFVDP